MKAKSFVLYEVDVHKLVLEYGEGKAYDATHLLTNGRANYILFEAFIGSFVGLSGNSQGGDSDLVDDDDRGHEVKSFRDIDTYPDSKFDWFHTAASSTFGPNNNGPVVKNFLKSGDYASALKICRETGFDKNDFYVYANTAQFQVDNPLRFIIVPTQDVMKLLSTEDPRLISRRQILDLAKERHAL